MSKSKSNNYQQIIASISAYIVLQLLCVPIMLSTGYDYSVLPSGGHAVIATILQAIIALIILSKFFPTLFEDIEDM